ncbi:jerky protein homolog-like [Galleria mellonella]|uniref:Jerky protein homolog-like n=1 Tax=Galleria mellonella TaxID=7137 RepID=A0ABM3MKB9_GALME|nr:jerky protein homolog-like [Galleria mellonella]
MSSQTQKRKHKTLTIKEKCDILDRLNRNETFSSLAREKLSNDATCKPFKLRFLQKVNDFNLDPSQVYNADESGLFWRVMPNKTFVSCNEKDVPGRKVSKERVTILPCANVHTHALKMVVIGKSNKPRAFKNIDLPWFDECFVPEVRKWLKDHNFPQKALLLLDNAPGHPSEEELTTEDKCITAMFLPPNCTALIQPMDQNIIQYNHHLATIHKSVTSEVIEQVSTETQISPEDLEVWYRGMDKEENVFLEMSDKDIIKEVSNNTTNDQEDNDDVIATSTSHRSRRS